MRIHLKNKTKVALVLSGGGIKAAAFHIGVCLALKEKGFFFEGGSKSEVARNLARKDGKSIRLYVGSSAGSFICSILASGYTLEALINAFEVGIGQKPLFLNSGNLSLRPIRYKDIFSINSLGLFRSVPLALMKRSLVQGGLESLIKERFTMNGFFTTKKIEKYLREYALPYNSFDELGVELFVVGTQLDHTKKAIFSRLQEDSKAKNIVYYNNCSISDAVAASTSLPPLFAPYPLKNDRGELTYFFDGEIRDTLSTHVAADHGADLVISSYSIQPYHFTEKVGSLNDFGIPAILNQALYQVIQQKIDRAIRYQSDTRAIYNAIDGYFRSAKLADEHREKVLEIIREKVRYRPKVDYIYIHPRADDYEMFFADHFSLNPKILERIVRMGFKSALNTLRQYDF
jgi:predicted acylesterase/phospholipase RssA